MFSWEKVTIIESPISIKDPPSNKCPTPLLARTLFHQIQYFELVQNSSAMHWQKLESGNWNLKAIAWNPESKTVLDSLTWGDTKHFQMRITYMISCFIGVYLSGFIFLVCWPRTF